jgi:Domain of unknown function (DUF1905)/Bacteriocin-protection, YdeI or OmpD-Associated
MIEFTAILKRFDQQGEKTGWTYFDVSADLASRLKPGNKKSFRVKGKLDDFKINGVALIPMGGGHFIMAVNAAMRKALGKRKGASVRVQLAVDQKGLELNKEFIACLADEPLAIQHFQSLPRGHQNYFSKWVESARTDPTRVKRITQAVNALAKGWGFSEMIRNQKKRKDELDI